MKKKRLPIPQKIKDKLLVECNHMCVRCGVQYHEVHHIDGDPSNNAEENLIVLCPNCHQGKVHGNGIKITSTQMKLYKMTKSKAVFSPIYSAVKDRIMFIETDEYENLTSDEISTRSRDLIGFISTLSHGEYYTQKLRDLLPKRLAGSLLDSGCERKREEIAKECQKGKIRNNRGEILRLVAECLEVQPL